jgi:hypothetical protein
LTVTFARALLTISEGDGTQVFVTRTLKLDGSETKKRFEDEDELVARSRIEDNRIITDSQILHAGKLSLQGRDVRSLLADGNALIVDSTLKTPDQQWRVHRVFVRQR